MLTRKNIIEKMIDSNNTINVTFFSTSPPTLPKAENLKTKELRNLETEKQIYPPNLCS